MDVSLRGTDNYYIVSEEMDVLSRRTDNYSLISFFFFPAITA